MKPDLQDVMGQISVNSCAPLNRAEFGSIGIRTCYENDLEIFTLLSYHTCFSKGKIRGHWLYKIIVESDPVAIKKGISLLCLCVYDVT